MEAERICWSCTCGKTGDTNRWSPDSRFKWHQRRRGHRVEITVTYLAERLALYSEAIS